MTVHQAQSIHARHSMLCEASNYLVEHYQGVDYSLLAKMFSIIDVACDSILIMYDNLLNEVD